MASGIRVLVVDDSAFARSMISKRLLTDDEIDKVDFAKDGQEAVDMVRSLKPDVVTLDVQMPRLDGLSALKQIMATDPTPVVMLSSLTGEDTETTIKALELGAVEFFLKPSTNSPESLEQSMVGLIQTVKTAARVPVARLARAMRSLPAQPAVATPPPGKLISSSSVLKRVVVIASSTGGPKALATLVPTLPTDLPIGYIIVQHMPAGFTTSLAERLDRSSPLRVKEAQKGDRVQAGTVLMAAGGYHLVVASTGEVDLTETPPEHGVRPAADVTMRSVAQAYGRKVVAAVLTGMGSDGKDGSGAINAAGGIVLAEHESTCAVYGMPKAVVEAGYARRVAPLNRIAREIIRACGLEVVEDAGAAD